VFSDIIWYARKNKDSCGGVANENMVEQVTKLWKLVQRQEQILSGAGLNETIYLSLQLPFSA
jgi:hypothetical protein